MTALGNMLVGGIITMMVLLTIFISVGIGLEIEEIIRRRRGWQ